MLQRVKEQELPHPRHPPVRSISRHQTIIIFTSLVLRTLQRAGVSLVSAEPAPSLK